MSPTHDPSSPLTSAPPDASPALLRLARRAQRSLDRFLAIEAAGGVVLLLAAFVAIVWANSPWAAGYFRVWHTPVGVRVGGLAFERPFAWVVNDGLMVLFFFVVGLEIRREVHSGELSEWRRAALPAAAAVGGMVVPALVYHALTRGTPPARPGWGVPMATDIAFAVGVLALLGKRVPPALRVLLLALAVIDDLGAIAVIALFYSSGVQVSGLLVAVGAFGGIVLLQRFGIRSKRAYVVPGLVAWAGIYAAGIHPTIAGVLVGLLTPVRAWLGPQGFRQGLEHEVNVLRHVDEPSLHVLGASMRHVDRARREAMAPADSLIETLHPWVAFVVMPLFGLANAGVVVAAEGLGGAAGIVAMGCGAGLALGKPVGILAACAVALRVRLGVLPAGLQWRHLVVLAVTAGIGFTMSIFIAGLAFADASLLAAAKLGVLAASAVAAVGGLVLGRALLRPTPHGGAHSADEAESKTEA